jgi:hypothetical protein
MFILIKVWYRYHVRMIDRLFLILADKGVDDKDDNETGGDETELDYGCWPTCAGEFRLTPGV